MEAFWQRLGENLFGRLDGPLHFRILVQPLMAVLFAILDGVKDARSGKPAFFWAMISHPEHRRELVKDGWKHTGKIFILAIVLDIFYQIKVLQAFYPGETLIVALLLAILPYLVMRGPVNRVVRVCTQKATLPEPGPAPADGRVKRTHA